MRIARLILALALVLSGLFVPAAVHAQGGLQLTTAYPALIVDPGGSATFTVQVLSSDRQRVDLAVTGAPDGWTTSLRGGGYTVAAVDTTGDLTAPAEVSLEVDVPTDAAAGTYHVVLEGRGASATVQLPVDIVVQALEPGSVSFETRTPVLRGSATATFNADLSLKNGTNQPIDFTLDATGPDGWRVSALPSTSSQAATMTVDAGATGTVRMSASAPSGTTAGTYTVTVTATGGPEPVQQDIQVEVTGSYNMSLSTSTGRLNADVTAGSGSKLTLVVSNTGDAPLVGVALTASAPEGWQVAFDQPSVDIAPGDSVNVVATITAADNAVAGDYIVTFRARNNDATATADVRTTVQTSVLGGLIGLLLLGAIAVGLLFVFRRYGRR
jgi:uncharacterized membrane protein